MACAFTINPRAMSWTPSSKRASSGLRFGTRWRTASTTWGRRFPAAQQRLCIARTIAIEPDVILMDEPCSALDPIATAAIEELILELKKDFTVVIVTHSMSQAARVSDYTGFMYLGRMVEFNKTEKIFSEPDQNSRNGTSPDALDEVNTHAPDSNRT